MFQSVPATLIKLIKSNSFQVTNCYKYLYKYKFHIGLKILLLSKQPRSNCSCSEFTLPKGLKDPRDPMCPRCLEVREWVSLFHQSSMKLA